MRIEELTDPTIFVEVWAKTKDSNDLDLSQLIIDHRDQILMFNKTFGSTLRRLTEKDLEHALNNFIRNMPRKAQEKIAVKYLGHPEALEQLFNWIYAVTGERSVNDVYVMAHWLWLVKRNLAGLPLVYHIMPIITSPKQGGGKSTAVTKLIAPLETVRAELEVTQVADERSIPVFSNYMIGFFDEMAGAHRMDMDTFKRHVTSGTLTYRPMRTNHMKIVKNRCSFIGATNNSIFEIIKDTTGIRRFFSIRALDKLNHELINSIDYEALWKGIDETRERGYLELVLEDVNKLQADMGMKDEVEVFMKNRDIEPGETLANGYILFEEYKKHCVDSNVIARIQAQTFYKKLRVYGFENCEKRDASKQIRQFFKINPKAVTEALNDNKSR